MHDKNQKANGGRGSHAGRDEFQQIMDARISPQALVLVETEKKQQLHQDDPADGNRKAVHVLTGDLAVEAEIMREVEGAKNQEDVSQHHDEEITIFQNFVKQIRSTCCMDD